MNRSVRCVFVMYVRMLHPDDMAFVLLSISLYFERLVGEVFLCRVFVRLAAVLFRLFIPCFSLYHMEHRIYIDARRISRLPMPTFAPTARTAPLHHLCTLSMSLQQRSVVWDWAQGMPSISPLHGLGVALRLHTGRRALLSATLFDGTDRSRLWSVRADVPLAKPSNTCFTAERAWQVPTTNTGAR